MAIITNNVTLPNHNSALVTFEFWLILVRITIYPYFFTTQLWSVSLSVSVMTVLADLVDDKNGSDELPDITDLTDDEQSTINLLLKSMLRFPLITQDDIADNNVLRKTSFWDQLSGAYHYEMKRK